MLNFRLLPNNRKRVLPCLSTGTTFGMGAASSVRQLMDGDIADSA